MILAIFQWNQDVAKGMHSSDGHRLGWGTDGAPNLRADALPEEKRQDMLVG